MKETKDKYESVFEVLKQGEIVHTGNSFSCYKYVLNHQPQSVYWAEKYGGWRIRKKEK